MKGQKLREDVDVIGLLGDLIAIPSENPPGDESRISDFLAVYLEERGFGVDIIETDPNRRNVIAEMDCGRGPKIVLNGHMDTKPAYPNKSTETDWLYDPFSAFTDGDKIYGLGSADMKGGLASMLAAAGNISRLRSDLAGKLTLTLVADEEMNSLYGMRKLVKEMHLQGDMGINFEPTELKVCPAQLGNVWLDIDVYGKMGHASKPYDAVNAVEKAIKLAEGLRKTVNKRRKINRHILFPQYPTLNIGLMEGGFHPGSVPGYCRLVIDIRVRPNETNDEYVKMVRDVIEKTITRDKDGFRAEFKNFGPGGLRPAEIERDSDVVIRLADAYRSVTGKEPEIAGLAGGTDANFMLYDWAIPTVVFGPGSLDQAHRINEYTSASQVVAAAKVTYAFLDNALRQK